MRSLGIKTVALNLKSISVRGRMFAVLLRRRTTCLLLFCIFTFLFSHSAVAAPSRNQRAPDDNSAASINDIRNSIDTLKHQVNNHETEIGIFDEKLKNLDSIIESVRDQLSDSAKNQKELLKGSASSLESKISSLETTSKGLVADLKQFQVHANESAAALAQYKQKITEIEKIILQQNQDIENLQGAIHTLMDLIQGKNSVSKTTSALSDLSGETNTYCIKAGDSLEKIARAHQTTIQVLKELNGLTTDRIVVGKTLKIPAPTAK